MSVELLRKVLVIVVMVIELLLKNPKLGISQAVKFCSKGSGIKPSVITAFIKKVK